MIIGVPYMEHLYSFSVSYMKHHDSYFKWGVF